MADPAKPKAQEQHERHHHADGDAKPVSSVSSGLLVWHPAFPGREPGPSAQAFEKSCK
jgi:hypothetical protein